MQMLYELTIRPIEYLMEGLVYFGSSIFPDVPALLFMLSLSVYYLTLPMYRRAEELQESERKRQERLDFWKSHIRDTFKGDERALRLAAYYRENGYRPTAALKSLLPLLLQIPFFLAAYRFLSGWNALSGVSFLWIRDLSEPDTAAGLKWLHLLPILMTAVNLLASLLYTQGHAKGERVQTILTALVFLVLLYGCPAGLVFYWTMNNVLSLVRQIVGKRREPERIRAWLFFFLGIAVLLYFFYSGVFLSFLFGGDFFHAVLCIIILILCFTPMVRSFATRPGKNEEKQAKGGAPRFRDVIFAEAFPAVLLGLVIPASVLASAPLDFVNPFQYTDPLTYAGSTFLVGAGLFLVWGSIFFLLLPERGRQRYFAVITGIGAVFAADYFLFGGMEGVVSENLIFDRIPEYPSRAVLLDLLLAGGLFLLVYRISKTKRRVLIRIQGVLLAASLLLAGKDLYRTSREVRSIKVWEKGAEEGSLRILPLSREGKNVVVLMLDRAISAYIPYIFSEKPKLQEQFDGFTWYPNTVSFGGATIFGMPALFGGYDYTPEALNRRNNETMPDKVNEALLVLPVLFGESGYEVTVCDPPYAGFSDLPDLSIYERYPYIDSYQLWGRFSATEGSSDTTQGRKRNFFFYSVMEVAPLFLRPEIYSRGWYMKASEGILMNDVFGECYNVLDAMPEMTEVLDDASDHLILMDNNATHSPCLLKYPDYAPYPAGESGGEDDDTEKKLPQPSCFESSALRIDMGVEGGREHYDVNMAAMLKLGEWFDHLREEGVYDNTRIIIVSDHGWDLGQFEELIVNEELDVQRFNALLMVKDFNDTGFRSDDTFMTNADVPAIATAELFADPADPFTGGRLDMSGKDGGVSVTLSDHNLLGENSGYRLYTEDSPWYNVNADIFRPENWVRVEGQEGQR